MGEVNKSFSSLSSLLSFFLVLFFLLTRTVSLFSGVVIWVLLSPFSCVHEKKNAEELKTEKKKPKANVAKKPKSQGEDKKEEESKDNTPTPPTPTEIVLKVLMHCEGCAREVRRCLKGFPGVDKVITDCKTHKVSVKGEKADQQKVLERVQRRSHRQPKSETVILRFHMFCGACAEEIKTHILNMEGVASAEPDLKKSEVRVEGVFDPAKLVEFVQRTGKQAVIVKEEAAEKKQKAEETKADEGEKEKKKEEGKGEEKEEEKKERVQRKSHRKVKFISPILKPPAEVGNNVGIQRTRRQNPILPLYKNNMGKLWTLLTHLHSLAGPVLTLLYPLYASVVAIESPSKVDEEQWLSYWILYSFLTLTEMLLQSILEWIPIWYDVKLVAVAWLVLPQFNGAAFLYERFVREQIRRYVTGKETQQQQQGSYSSIQMEQKKQPTSSAKGKKKSVDFILPKKDDHDVY